MRSQSLVVALSVVIALVPMPGYPQVAACFGRAPTITAATPIVFGTTGNDVIVTGKGPQDIFALSGNDRICAGRGHDNIDGGQGRDGIDGGKGRDTCVGEIKRRCEN